MDYGLITFRSQPCDKLLDDEFYQMITPILNKTERYVVSQEYANTPDAHYHIIMSFHSPKHDITKLTQKFKSKSFINWIERTKSTMTVISTKFDKSTSPGLEIKKINSNEEDLIKTLGYVCKENVIKTNGFTEQEITEACKYYHTCERKAPKVKSDWKILNVKTIIPWMEKVAEEEQIQPFDKMVPYYMARRKMYLDVSDKQQEKIKDTLRIAYDDPEHPLLKEALAAKLYNSEDPIIQVELLSQENIRLQKIIAQYQNLLEQHDIQDTTTHK